MHEWTLITKFHEEMQHTASACGLNFILSFIWTFC